MNVFVDLHHAILYKSLQMLFEKRLGWNLYRPIGTEWFDKGYWMNAEIYNHHPDTIKQYLEIRNTVPTKMGPRNEVVGEQDGYYEIENSYKNEKALTYDQFMEMKPDIVIASYHGNIEPYKRLAKSVGAKHIMQAGNHWPIDWGVVDNLMSSTAPHNYPKNKNVVFYHQEIDLEIYNPPETFYINNKNLNSFVNCLPEHDMHKQDWEDFQTLEKLLSDYTFKSYGISCRDGIIKEQKDIATKMKDSLFGIHLKGNGDGFGHVAFNWFASGKPVIYRGSQYQDKLWGELLEHEQTGLDIDKMSLTKVAEYIKTCSSKQYSQLCQNVMTGFSEKVNFNEEEKLLRQFLERLL